MKKNLSFIESIAMLIRSVPVKKIKNNLSKLYGKGIEDIDAYMLEAHYLANGDIDAVTEAMLYAKVDGIETNWNELCVVDLATKQTDKDVLTLLKATLEKKEVVFSEFATEPSQSIEGFCRDGNMVQCKVFLKYSPSIMSALGGDCIKFEHVQDRIASSLSASIYASDSFNDIKKKHSQISSKLLSIGRLTLKSIHEVNFEAHAL